MNGTDPTTLSPDPQWTASAPDCATLPGLDYAWEASAGAYGKDDARALEEAIPLEDGIERVRDHRARLAPRDVTTSLPHWTYHEAPADEGRPSLRPMVGLQAEDVGELWPTRHALQQTAARIEPVTGMWKYLESCPPALRVPNMNYWLQASQLENGRQADRYAQFRTVYGGSEGDILRGVLSDRFAPFDDAAFLDALWTHPRIRTARVSGLSISEKSTHISLVWPDECAALSEVGSVVARGLQLTNSEVGCASVRVEPMLLTLRCVNLLVGRDGKGHLIARHVGDPQRIREAVGVGVDDAVGKADELVQQARQATQMQVPDLQNMLKGMGLGDKMLDTVKECHAVEMVESGTVQPTVWSVAGAVTRHAQTLPAADRYGLGRLAGEVVVNPQKYLTAARRISRDAHTVDVACPTVGS